MKKILAMILAFIISLSNNTDYTITSDKPYTKDYYTINVDDPPDYRKYYGTISTSDATENCKTTNFSAQGKKVSGSDGFWFVNNMSASLDSIDGNIVEHHKNNDGSQSVDYYVADGIFTDGNYIIMPYTGTLQCESKTNDCKSMTVFCKSPNGTEYKLVFANMECWYCDVSRDNPTFHTSDEQTGKKFMAGNVLGKATSETIVKIIPTQGSSAVGTATLSQFYSGSYTPY